MVHSLIKIPKHGGPDGQGLPAEVISDLIQIIENNSLSEAQLNQAIELCLSASTQSQWNEVYMPMLIDKLKK